VPFLRLAPRWASQAMRIAFSRSEGFHGQVSSLRSGVSRAQRRLSTAGQNFSSVGADDALAVEGDQSLLTFDARVESRADAPDASAVLRVRAGSNEEAVHGPVMVGAERQAIVRLVVAGHVERDEVARRPGRSHR